MEKYSTGRKVRAMVGVALILASASGGTSVMNAIIPFLLEGMKVDLTTFMIGPTLATICAAVMSALGTKVIDALTPKWSMLLGTICGCATMFVVGIATSVPLWIVANICNGIVLAFATYAAAGGVVAEFYGQDTQKVFGIVTGIVALLVSGWMALTSLLLTTMDYRTLFNIYAVAILVIGVISNFVLIGRIPRRRPISDAPKAKEDDAEAAPAAQEVPGFTLGQLLRKGASIYLFLASMVFVAWCASGITSYASVYFTSFGMAAAAAAGMLSLYSFCGAILKFFSGFLIKKLGPKVMTILVYCAFALGIVCLLAWSSIQALPLAVLGIALCSFISYAMIIPGLFIPDLYGMKDYVAINSAGMAAYYVGAVALLMGLSVIISAHGAFTAFIILAIVAIVVMALLFMAVVTSPMRKDKAQPQAK